MNIQPLSEVFKTVGLPPYTYVKPTYYGEVRADILQPGKHLLIEGPSGIGKTCVVFKVFEDLSLRKDADYIYLSGRDADAGTRLLSALDSALTDSSAASSHPLTVVDDFHLFPSEDRASVGSALKRISDRAFESQSPHKFILIGIPTTGSSLLSESYDLGPRLGSYRFTRATDDEIDKLISEGESVLNVLFEDRQLLLNESAGNFWLAQFICNKVCATQEIFQTAEHVQILTFDILRIRQRLMAELSQRYGNTVKVFAKGKKWRPGGNKPYLEVLLALSKEPDSVVTYDRILNRVAESRRPGLKAIRGRIPEVIHAPEKKVDLRKQIAFDPASGFTIEDPLFRYYLSNIDSEVLYRDLGVEPTSADKFKRFSYDVGFSFAGEIRPLVEAVNSALKSEDVITFYDFDQQAILLALDLEEALGRIYSEACTYYLVFLDEHYRMKVWTKYEKEIMTKGDRKSHIIPIVVDDYGLKGNVGIPNTIGRIDLRDQWTQIQAAGEVTEDIIKAIRNRCVVPVLDKLDE